jgi:hypothetical protein
MFVILQSISPSISSERDTDLDTPFHKSHWLPREMARGAVTNITLSSLRVKAAAMEQAFLWRAASLGRRVVGVDRQTRSRSERTSHTSRTGNTLATVRLRTARIIKTVLAQYEINRVDAPAAFVVGALACAGVIGGSLLLPESLPARAAIRSQSDTSAVTARPSRLAFLRVDRCGAESCRAFLEGYSDEILDFKPESGTPLRGRVSGSEAALDSPATDVIQLAAISVFETVPAATAEMERVPPAAIEAEVTARDVADPDVRSNKHYITSSAADPVEPRVEPLAPPVAAPATVNKPAIREPKLAKADLAPGFQTLHSLGGELYSSGLE